MITYVTVRMLQNWGYPIINYQLNEDIILLKTKKISQIKPVQMSQLGWWETFVNLLQKSYTLKLKKYLFEKLN